MSCNADCKTRIVSRSRLITGLSLLFMAVWLLGQAMAQAKPQLSGSRDSSLMWKPVVMAQGRVVAVGAKRLPYPVNLPKSVRPLGGKAMVRVGHEPTFIVGFELYFSAKDERSIRRWAESSASHFPIPLGNPKIVRGADLRTARGSWIYRIVVKGNDTSIRLVVTKYPFRPSIVNSEDPIGPVWTSNESPIRNQNSFIGIRIYYNRVNVTTHSPVVGKPGIR